MSRTKKSATGDGKTIQTRYRTRRETVVIDAEKQLQVLRAWAANPWPYGENRVCMIAEHAAAFLHAQGLPSTSLVRYDVTTFILLADGEPAVRGCIAILPKFLEVRGFGCFDDEMIAARIVGRADLILNPKTDRDRLIELMYLFSRDVADWGRFRAGDAAAAKRGRKTFRKAWATVLAHDLVTADPTASAQSLWDTIEESEEEGDEPNVEADGKQWIVYRDGQQLVAADDRTGRVEQLSARSWRRYVGEAKKKLNWSGQ